MLRWNCFPIAFVNNHLTFSKNIANSGNNNNNNKNNNISNNNSINTIIMGDISHSSTIVVQQG